MTEGSSALAMWREHIVRPDRDAQFCARELVHEHGAEVHAWCDATKQTPFLAELGRRIDAGDLAGAEWFVKSYEPDLRADRARLVAMGLVPARRTSRTPLHDELGALTKAGRHKDAQAFRRQYGADLRDEHARVFRLIEPSAPPGGISRLSAPSGPGAPSAPSAPRTARRGSR